MTLAADDATPGIARQRVRRWLETLWWPAEALDDIELAVNEAVSNAAEHAYPRGTHGEIVVEAAVEAMSGGRRRASFVVRDGGRWRAEPADRSRAGRGVLIMTGTMAEVVIRRGSGDAVGTTVRLLSIPVPDAPAG